MNVINKWINNQKLYVKILIVVIGSSIVLAVGYVLIWQIVCDAYNKIIYEKNAQTFIAYSEQMDNKFEKFGTITLSIIGDNSIQKNLSTYKELEYMGEGWFDIREKLTKQLANHIYSTDNFLSFGIYLSDLKVIGTKADLSNDSIEMLMQKAMDQKGNMEIVVHQNRAFMVRQIRKISTFENLGVMIGELDISGILRENKRQYKNSGITLNVSVFVGGECIYCDDENIHAMKEDGWVIDKGYFITQCTSKSGWVYLLYTPYVEILRTIQKTNMAVVLLMAALTVCVIFLCRFLLNRTLKHLGELVQKFDAYGKGILPTHEELEEYKNRKDEIGYLYQQFDKMAYEHKRLEEENYNRMLLNKEAQYRQLQKQVQPHFVFNTLSLISWMAYQHDDMEIAEITNSLSQLIRASMTFNENKITVEQEMRLVENYIYIQRVRYGKRIEFSMNIPPEMYHVEIPQMTLQPLVENAITHALEEMLETCIINVYGRVENDTAIFVVEDNGGGIDEDIIEKLASGEKQARGNGIGLLNVHQRIQIAFSEEYGLSFRRENDLTRVYVKVPYIAEG